MYAAMRHVAHNLADLVGRSIQIDNLHIKKLPISRLSACTDDPEAETVGIYLLIDEDLSGEGFCQLKDRFPLGFRCRRDQGESDRGERPREKR